ncbi:hypothetical protein [Streptomyces swartbergensis]|uniref:Uncharacterized protein n=1 Tax=Streptomyces swartbergensis TaxID=487165 RepID=A0A243S735_9ACTN|nr:hypothetical protein [Streptomyces swartbergensis]OUD03368.1 hypothetical protein CA983_10180 [Streptomyces swartbergensis]
MTDSTTSPAAVPALPVPVGDQPQPLDDQRLAEIAARVEALNSFGLPGGTWTASPRDDKSVTPPEMAHVVEDVLRTSSAVFRSSVAVFGEEDHAEFVAHTPADMAALLAEVQRLKAELAEQTRYAARLESEICQCQPELETGEYVHETDCPVVEVQMQSFGLPAPTTNRAEETS